MVQIAKQQMLIQTLRGELVSTYHYLFKHHDTSNTEKIKQLAHKLEKKEFVIAFCGHFSAGKSTMINNIVGENLLPSSPIPTSANLVKVKSGEEYAKVFFKNEKPRLYLAPYDYELVKKYCKDGDQIKEIEISYNESKLPANTIIMDTPGIDSADDAHRIATESAIHLADLVFYVMDYNHVQSELNFLFTKELAEAGKEVYLVINQIDKHKEEELSFEEFQNSVLESFASWSVKPARIFYTSLKNVDLVFNQFTDLQQFINEKLEMKDQFLSQSISRSLKRIVWDHLEQTRKREEITIQPVKKILEELSSEDQKNLVETYSEKKTKLQEIEEGFELAERQFDQETSHILKNAYLMPSQTRSLAESYLEACQPEFKVGFLFGKQKTFAEREARLESFYKDMLDKAKSQLEWHLREFLGKEIKFYGLEQTDLLERVNSFSIHFRSDLLVNVVKPGARLSGNYVLNYTDEVANEIKKIAKNFLFEFKKLFFQALDNRNAILKERYKNEFKNIERYVHAFEELNRFKTKFADKEKKMEELLLQNGGGEQEFDQLFMAHEEEFEVVHGEYVTNSVKVQKSDHYMKKQLYVDSIVHQKASDQLQETSKRLKKASQLINSLPGFNKIARELEEKAERLKNKGFTVALFGAFSAGKSSFANALMGEKVLPVSPNPTTAAINRIKPVNETHRHGTVLVKFKEISTMQDDLNRSLKVFGLHSTSFQEALKKMDQLMLQKESIGAFEKTHYAFLQAFIKGFGTYGEFLGKVINISLNEFSDFVVKEEKSCFIEWIDLYYDCELTRKGITLVDTPGADSINARHTGVAFDYIKNSDAILFVTYYNHAFSKADREFLIQLGRVKDSFQLDKMFFIINAIDLAEDDDEKETVAEYVQEQLIKYGIRNPHLFSLSSMLALKEKKDNADTTISRMDQFERSFYPFISNDLTKMAIASSEIELKRVSDLIKKLIQSSMEDQTMKERKRSEIEKQKKAIMEIIKAQTVQTLKSLILQEANELIYYLKQRVFLRFGDFFKEAFNPTLLRDDGRNLKKALQLGLDELLESLGFDFAQEMRATTVRLDRFLEKKVTEFQAGIVRSILEINQDLSFSIFEFKREEELDFQNAFKDVNKQLFQKAMSTFKNPKSFFERNEKRIMSEELYNALAIPAEEYSKFEQERVNSYYVDILNGEFTRLLRQMVEQVEDYYVSLLSTLDGGVSIEQLIEIQQTLEEF
ncbi:dynamin family protein [Neobacillus sp. PS3-40]|uniref:dynamin family protein n=1 Tax=Neobacillus sp. PS3-40 TaxID=3070679 RepID=UPI0027E071CE|nr:dynamin family protein [Neobacillus sp. PS3-40]WML45042.1 dynamin family protein [Neobacillus sp. PS3-40]